MDWNHRRFECMPLNGKSARPSFSGRYFSQTHNICCRISPVFVCFFGVLKSNESFCPHAVYLSHNHHPNALAPDEIILCLPYNTPLASTILISRIPMQYLIKLYSEYSAWSIISFHSTWNLASISVLPILLMIVFHAVFYFGLHQYIGSRSLLFISSNRRFWLVG